jgi:hypothetical protein
VYLLRRVRWLRRDDRVEHVVAPVLYMRGSITRTCALLGTARAHFHWPDEVSEGGSCHAPCGTEYSSSRSSIMKDILDAEFGL